MHKNEVRRNSKRLRELQKRKREARTLVDVLPKEAKFPVSRLNKCGLGWKLREEKPAEKPLAPINKIPIVWTNAGIEAMQDILEWWEDGSFLNDEETYKHLREGMEITRNHHFEFSKHMKIFKIHQDYH